MNHSSWHDDLRGAVRTISYAIFVAAISTLAGACSRGNDSATATQNPAVEGGATNQTAAGPGKKPEPSDKHFTAHSWTIGCAEKEASEAAGGTSESDPHLAVGNKLKIMSAGGKYNMQVTGSTNADWDTVELTYFAREYTLGPQDPAPFDCEGTEFAAKARTLSGAETASLKALAASGCSSGLDKREHMAGTGNLHKEHDEHGNEGENPEEHCLLIYTRPAEEPKKSEIWVKYWHTSGGSLHGGVAHGGDD